MAAFAPFGRGHPRSVFSVRGEYTVEARQVNSGFRHKGREFRNEIHRLKDHVSRAISIRRFQLISNLAMIRE
jgi:hypothetical protein